MNRIRATVVATLLAVWCFPMVSSAKALSSEPAAAATLVSGTEKSESSAAATPSGDSEAATLATREQQTKNLQDFRGGRAIYIGSGVVLILLIILLILII